MVWKPPPFDLQAHRRERAAKEAEAAQLAAIEKTRDPRGPFWLRFQVWFFTLSFFYWIIASTNLGPWGLPNTNGAGSFFGNLIGIFVPIGPNNVSFLFINPLAWVAVGLIIWVLRRANSYFESLRLSHSQKIIHNLVTLFMLTLATDMLMFRLPVSLMNLFQSL